MNKIKFSAIALALVSSTSIAGTMGAVAPEKLFFIEGGVSYSHAFYKDNYTAPESYTQHDVNGVAINGKDFYPQDYFGGYFGASIYMSDWLLNTRLDMYGKKTKSNTAFGTTMHVAPTRLSFTTDRVFGDINQFSYGVGAGAVVESVNQGEAYVALTHGQPSETFSGRTRIDPTVEGFAMYRFDNNLGVKFNIGYQIPVNNRLSNGDLNLNLGVNYAFVI